MITSDQQLEDDDQDAQITTYSQVSRRTSQDVVIECRPGAENPEIFDTEMEIAFSKWRSCERLAHSGKHALRPYWLAIHISES